MGAQKVKVFGGNGDAVAVKALTDKQRGNTQIAVVPKSKTGRGAVSGTGRQGGARKRHDRLGRTLRYQRKDEVVLSESRHHLFATLTSSRKAAILVTIPKERIRSRA